MPNATDLRVLILSAAVPQSWFAGSVLLYRLFKDHPADGVKAVGPRPQPSSEVLSCEYVELAPARSSRVDMTRLAELKRSLEALSLLGRISDRRVDLAVGAFQADVVVSVMERFDYVDAAHRFCRRRGLPLALIVHDRLESFDRVYAPFADAQRRRIAAIYRDAAARLCISPEMERCLAEIYGASGTVLYPNRPDELSPRPLDDSCSLKKPPQLVVGYAGALNYGYGDRLAEVMPVLAAAGIALRIYSREAPADMPGVTYAGSFRSSIELWDRLKSECDMAWLPYSHSADQRSLYETHFPSKLAEYLALGLPVAITGPAYASGVRWGLRHPDAVVTVADDTAERIRDTFAALRADHDRRRQLAAAGLAAGQSDFDPREIRRTFFAALGAAAARRAAGAA